MIRTRKHTPEELAAMTIKARAVARKINPTRFSKAFDRDGWIDAPVTVGAGSFGEGVRLHLVHEGMHYQSASLAVEPGAALIDGFLEQVERLIAGCDSNGMVSACPVYWAVTLHPNPRED